MNLGRRILVLGGLALGAVSSPLHAEDVGVGCSWVLKTDPDTVNAAFPDDQATYWLARFTSVPGTRLVLRGVYPFARYFSFNVYDEPQRPVDSIADQDVVPDPGSVNSFATPGAEPGGRYTAYVEFTAKPSSPATNTLYAGAMSDGRPNPAGFIMYRVYVSDDAAERDGSVPLPRISLELPGGAGEIPFGECDPPPPSTGGQVNRAVMDSSYPDEGPRSLPFPLASNPPEFSVFYGLVGSSGGFYSNQHNAYMRLSFSRQFGDLLVFRAKAPGFPDTRAGEPVVTLGPSGEERRPDLRYWSICQNEFATQRFVQCAPDFLTPLDGAGYFTVVISDPADRPANATAANGVTWLPWGGVYYDGMVLYRHMLPNPLFPQAIQNVPQGTAPESVLGEYFPVASYCTKAAFESGGTSAEESSAACFDAP
jgi:hypothetical protein